MEYYHQLITEKSFKILQDLKRQYKFVLIGGWAVFLYTKSLKSKDIDIICDYDELEKIRTRFDIFKNERLKKYEIKIEEIDVDIYLPFYSNPGIPPAKIKNYLQNIEGFIVPKPEALLILKQKAYQERCATPKGEKDKIDIIALLKNIDFDFDFYNKVLQENNLLDLKKDLRKLLDEIKEIPELDLNYHQFSQFKKVILEKL
ncbi:MAG: hypothetical protein AB1465_04590 [Patescibacteria group bacterium]